MADQSSEVRAYLRRIGRAGGRKSRRTLSREQAREMVRVREARKLFRIFRSRCFWSAPAGLEIGNDDIDWVAAQLRKHGGAAGWRAAARLCR